MYLSIDPSVLYHRPYQDAFKALRAGGIGGASVSVFIIIISSRCCSLFARIARHGRSDVF